MSGSSTAFKAGDVVRLKSGGPKMTVSSVSDYYGELMVYCDWFDAQKRSTDKFSPLALEMAQ